MAEHTDQHEKFKFWKSLCWSVCSVIFKNVLELILSLLEVLFILELLNPRTSNPSNVKCCQGLQHPFFIHIYPTFLISNSFKYLHKIENIFCEMKEVYKKWYSRKQAAYDARLPDTVSMTFLSNCENLTFITIFTLNPWIVDSM